MDPKLFGFVGTTLFEAILPGPSLAKLIDTRLAYGKPASLAFVGGTTLANFLWVAVILFLGAQLFEANGFWRQLLLYTGSCYLILLSTRRIISAAMTTLGAPGGSHGETEAKGGSHFVTGLTMHFLNPANPAYYGSAFASVLSGRSAEVALLLASLPILADLAVYLVVALIPEPSSIMQNQKAKLALGTASRLFSSLLLFFLAAHAFSDEPSDQLVIPGEAAIPMALGCLAGAMTEAYSLVLSRKGLNNKLLWRVVAVWAAWFGAMSLAGGFYTLKEALRIEPGTLVKPWQDHLRISFTVAAALAVSLSFAKAVGELQDERNPGSGSASQVNLGWAGDPRWSGVGALAFIVTVFILVTFTGLRFTNE